MGSIWVSGGVASAWVLMAGVAASRLGLWMFDLAVTQLTQDNVPDSERCVVGGVQNSLQSIFDLLTYIMAIIVTDLEDGRGEADGPFPADGVGGPAGGEAAEE